MSKMLLSDSETVVEYKESETMPFLNKEG